MDPKHSETGRPLQAIVDVRIHANGQEGRAVKANELQPESELAPSLSQLSFGTGEAWLREPFILKPPPTTRKAALGRNQS